MRYRPLATLGVATAAAVLLLTATARADFHTLYDDYRADGVIDGCAYSSSDLSAGLSDIPADVREYDPGFAEALNTALEQVAAGCGSTASPTKAKNESIAADGSPGPAVPRPPAFQAATAGRGMPGVLAALIVVLATALATAALLAASHYYGWDLPGRLASIIGDSRLTERRLANGLRWVRDKLGF